MILALPSADARLDAAVSRIKREEGLAIRRAAKAIRDDSQPVKIARALDRLNALTKAHAASYIEVLKARAEYDALTAGAEDVAVEQIKAVVADAFGIAVADMTAQRRTARIAVPRMVAMSLAYERGDRSLAEVGEAFGGRDHGTVLHARKTVAAMRLADANFDLKVSLIEASF